MDEPPVTSRKMPGRDRTSCADGRWHCGPRHLTIKLFIAVTAIVIFPIPLGWSMATACCAVGMYLFQLQNPEVAVGSAAATREDLLLLSNATEKYAKTVENDPEPGGSCRPGQAPVMRCRLCHDQRLDGGRDACRLRNSPRTCRWPRPKASSTRAPVICDRLLFSAAL